MEEAHGEARKHLKRSAEHQKRGYDHKASIRPVIECGHPVWLYNPTIKKGVCRMLTSPWKGPYVVAKRLSDVTYMLEVLVPNHLQHT